MAQITLNSTGVASNGSLVLQSNGTTAAVTIDTSQRAAFVAGTAALPAITTTGDTNTGIFFPAADTIAFSEGGAEAMRIDSSGNVLVGTTIGNPSAPFTGNIVAALFKTMSTSGSVTNGGNTTLFTIGVDSAYLVTVQTQNASGLSTTALVRYVTGGNPVATTTLAGDSASFVVSVSGTAVRITNNLGGDVAFSHSSIRIF